MKYTERLRLAVEDIWEQSHNHPFVQGIGNGTLPIDKYRFYMCQDYVYLIDYAKLFALGSIKATDLDTMSKYATVLNETLGGEMELHRKNAAKIGITTEELENTKITPTAAAYVNYMLKVSECGSLAELNAVLLPCMWSYWELGKILEKGNGINHEIYGEWIRTYSGGDFVDVTKWLIEQMDILVEGKTDRELDQIEHYFVIASKYEYAFWEMAYQGEKWPI